MKLIEKLKSALGRPQKMKRAAFNAATVNRLTQGLGGISVMSADNALFFELKLMRNRARELERNNDYMRKFLADSQKNILGSRGIGLEPKCWLADGKENTTAPTPDLESAVKISEAWRQWSKKRWCTVTRRHTWRQVQRLVVRSVIRDGECLIRKVRDPLSPFGMRLQLLEADHLDDDYNTAYLPDGHRIVMGVELDANGMAVTYHLLTSHPGDVTLVSQPRRREPVPASEIIHVYNPDRVGQTRGFPHACSVILRMSHLAGYEEAEVIAARAAAQKMAAITKTVPEGWNGEPDGRGNVIEESEAGSVVELPMGMDIKPLDWNHPNAIYPEFRKGCLHGIASGLSVSYNFLASDLEGVSYSSLRSGALDERETWKELQSFFVDDLFQPVYEDWLFSSMMGGALTLPGGFSRFDLYNEPQWNPRRWDWVDPKNDVEANVMAIEQGFKSRRQIVSETTGRDLDDVYREQEEDDALAKDHGLSFPRGSAAPQQPAPPPPAPVESSRSAINISTQALTVTRAVTRSVRFKRDAKGSLLGADISEHLDDEGINFRNGTPIHS